jgi:hypothetical protein
MAPGERGRQFEKDIEKVDWSKVKGKAISRPKPSVSYENILSKGVGGF